MTVYVVWTSEPVPEPLPGPWREMHVAAPGLLLVDSEETLSRVYHEMKWSLPDGTALLVTPVAGTPKVKGLAPGTQTWLRERTGK